jgi:hypothetical protein
MGRFMPMFELDFLCVMLMRLEIMLLPQEQGLQ